MNYLFHDLILISIFIYVNGTLFDNYSGKLIVISELRNSTGNCVIYVKPCTPHEGSRVDGTCNNFKFPSKGAARGPYLRLIANDGQNPNNTVQVNSTIIDNSTVYVSAASSRKPLPSARKVRTTLQSTGRVHDKRGFTVAAAHFLELIARDISALDGPLDYLRKRQDCCEPSGAADSRCMPIMVPDDDPYLKVTDIRCLNFSRAATFQHAGCVNQTKPQEQINFQTPVLDLSTIYGIDDKSMDEVREYKHGLLKMFKKGNAACDNATSCSETEKEKRNEVRDVCFKDNSNETICYQFGFPEIGNTDLRTTALSIIFMREHNRLATVLRRINPCWRDDRIFKVARQINVATATNIFMYELLPHLLGYNNMVRYNLISERVEHLTVYDEDAVPLVYSEYDIATRFFRTFMDGRIKRYDENNTYLGDYSLSDTLFRSDILEQDSSLEEINRGMFYQNAAAIDDIQDPEISEKFYGKLQRAHDLAATDIQRGRDLGVHPYNEYRKLCGLREAQNFEDLLDVMDIEKVLALKSLYSTVDEIELLPAVMSESLIKGTSIGPTLFCIMTKQLQLFRFADRFWFERGDQFHSLSRAQLLETRRTNMARLACDNAPGVNNIQPRAFLNVGPTNMLIPCTYITGPDLTTWQDPNCQSNKFVPPGSTQKTPTIPKTKVAPLTSDFNEKSPNQKSAPKVTTSNQQSVPIQRAVPSVTVPNEISVPWETVPNQKTGKWVTVPNQKSVPSVTVPNEKSVACVTLPNEKAVTLVTIPNGKAVPSKQKAGEWVTVPSKKAVPSVTVPNETVASWVTIPNQKLVPWATVPNQKSAEWITIHNEKAASWVTLPNQNTAPQTTVVNKNDVHWVTNSGIKYPKSQDPQKMISDYSTFFDTFLSNEYKKQVKSFLKTKDRLNF